MLSRRVFSFNYVLTDSKGDVLDKSEGQALSFLEGAGQIIPALEQQILDLKSGDKKKVSLTATEAYGEQSDKMVMDVPKADVAHLDVQVGSYLQLEVGDGRQKVVRVTKISDDTVTLDGNHPLAGQALVFDIEMVSIRPATTEEMAHGHAHGPGGHNH